MSTRIVITDETGALEKVSVTDTGFSEIGSGAGASRISVNGIDLSDNNAQIGSQRNVSASVNPSQGSTTVPPFGSTTVSIPSTWDQFLTWSVFSIARHTFQSGFPLTCNTTSGGPEIQGAIVIGGVQFTSQDSQVPACPLSPGTTPVTYTYL